MTRASRGWRHRAVGHVGRPKGARGLGKGAVVLGSLGRVVEDLVRVRDGGELLRSFRSWVEVWVVLAREAPVGAADIARWRVACHA